MSASDNTPKRSTSGLLGGLVGLIAGGILALAGLCVLAYGEARLNKLSALARAPHVNAADPAPTAGTRVTLSGSLRALELAHDPLLRGDFVFVRRSVETCAWMEQAGKERGGPPVYRKRWLKEIPDSSRFHSPGYDNPKARYQDAEVMGQGLMLDDTALAEPLQVVASDLLAPTRQDVVGARIVAEQWAYLSSSRECREGGAAIGDQRVTFRVLRPGDLVTAFGALKGKRLDPYAGELLLARGARAQLAQALEGHKAPMSWVARVGGGVLVWTGLTLFFAPIVALVAWIPLVGGLARGAMRLATVILALLVTLGVIYRGYGISAAASLLGGLIR